MTESVESFEGSVRDLGSLLLERDLINPAQLWGLVRDLETRKGTPGERTLVQLLVETGAVADAALAALRREAGMRAQCSKCGRPFQIDFFKASVDYTCKTCGGKLETSRSTEQTLVAGRASDPSLDRTVTTVPRAPDTEGTILLPPGGETVLDMTVGSAKTVTTRSPAPPDPDAEGTILVAPGSDPTMLDMTVPAIKPGTGAAIRNQEKNPESEGTILVAPGAEPTMLDLGAVKRPPAGPPETPDLEKTNPTIVLGADQSSGTEITKVGASDSNAGTLVVSPDPALEKTVQAPHMTRPGPKAPIAPSLPPDVEEAKKDPKRHFGKYIIVRELGRGGQAVVYKAWDTSLAQNVALKIIRLEAEEDASSEGGTSSETDEVRHFQREAQMAARLRHPNIVRIYELGCIDNRHYLTMEMVDGPTLMELIHGGKQRNALTTFQGDPEKFLTIIRDVARAVHYAHTQTPPVIHRDLKPHNVLITPEGTPCVADFGLAKEVDVGRSETMTGVVKGTPSYMAPEQAEGRSRETDQRTDVYSLGAILYEILTGKPPFTGDSVRQVLNQIVVKLPDRPNDVIARNWEEAQKQQSQSTTLSSSTQSAFKTKKRKGPPLVARQLETICLKAIEKKKTDRYQSAKDLANDIDRFLQHLEIEAREPGLLRKAMRKMRAHPIITGSAAAIILCSGVGYGAIDYARRHQKGSIDLLVTSASDDLKAKKWSDLQKDIENLKKADPKHDRIAEFEDAYTKHLADMKRRETQWTEELKKFRVAPSKPALEELRSLFREAGDLQTDFSRGLNLVHLAVEKEVTDQARELIGSGADPRWLDEKVRQPARTCRGMIDYLQALVTDKDFGFKCDDALRTWRDGLDRLLTYEGTWALRVNVDPFAEIIVKRDGKEVAREFTPLGVKELEVGKGYQIEICWPSEKDAKQKTTKGIDSLKHGEAVVVTGDIKKSDIRVAQMKP